MDSYGMYDHKPFQPCNLTVAQIFLQLTGLAADPEVALFPHAARRARARAGRGPKAVPGAVGSVGGSRTRKSGHFSWENQLVFW